MIGSQTISFTIPVNWLLSILVVAVGLIIAYIFVPADVRDVLKFVAPVLAGSMIQFSRGLPPQCGEMECDD